MKKVIRIDGVLSPFENGLLISYLQEYFELMKQQGYTNLDITYDERYGEVDFTPYYERFENDAEYSLRLSREADFKKIVELHELKELKRLKEKYEK